MRVLSEAETWNVKRTDSKRNPKRGPRNVAFPWGISRNVDMKRGFETYDSAFCDVSPKRVVERYVKSTTSINPEGHLSKIKKLVLFAAILCCFSQDVRFEARGRKRRRECFVDMPSKRCDSKREFESSIRNVCETYDSPR